MTARRWVLIDDDRRVLADTTGDLDEGLEFTVENVYGDATALACPEIGLVHPIPRDEFRGAREKVYVNQRGGNPVARKTERE